MESQFWLVWNPQGRAPTYQHPSEELARKEADRLSLLNPGQKFYVMEAMGYATKRECEWVPFGPVPF